MSHYPGLVKHVMNGPMCNEYYQTQGTDPKNGYFGMCPKTIDLVIPAVQARGIRVPIGSAKANGEASYRYVPQGGL